jgi:hypothetical protein
MSDEFHPYQTPIKQMNEQNMRACLKLFQLKGVFNPSYEMCSYLVSDNVSNRITFTGENLWKKKKILRGIWEQTYVKQTSRQSSLFWSADHRSMALIFISRDSSIHASEYIRQDSLFLGCLFIQLLEVQKFNH